MFKSDLQTVLKGEPDEIKEKAGQKEPNIFWEEDVPRDVVTLSPFPNPPSTSSGGRTTNYNFENCLLKHLSDLLGMSWMKQVGLLCLAVGFLILIINYRVLDIKYK